MRRLVACVSIAFLLPCLAHASEPSGWYVGGAVGSSKYDASKSNLDSSVKTVVAIAVPGFSATNFSSNLSNNKTGYKLQLGYQFNPYLAVEGGYVDLDNVNYSSNFSVGLGSGTFKTSLRSSGWNTNIVGALPVSEKLSLLGKVGFIDAKVETTFGGTATVGGVTTPISFSTSSTKWKPVYGLGASYSITNNIAVRGEWDRYSKLGDAEIDVDLLSVGVVYKF